MSAQVQTHAADRIYYDAQEQLSFTATVTSIREVARVDGRQVWQIALDRTAFYPEGGGQPCDTGTLIATARSGASLEAPVTDVQEDESGEVWHTTAKPLQEGTVVHGVVNAERRHDHMQQHSGQHLLSAVLWRDFHLKTVSFHLGPETCTIDLEGGPLPEEALAAVELAVNAVVAEALPVRTRYLSQQEAQAKLQDGRLRKLPPREGRIRLVEMPGVDLNACGGTHVATTAAIGPILLRGTERVRGAVRLQFLCGARALRAARYDHQGLSALALALSTGTAELQGSVARLQAENRGAARERTALLQALATAEAAAIAATGGVLQPLLLHTLDAQLPGQTPEFSKLLASALVAAGAPRALVALPQGETCTVVLAASAASGNCGTELRTALAALEGRGGGSRELAQGSLPTTALQALATALQV